MEKIIRETAEKILEIQKEKGSCIIAVDGRCASGKSTFGKELADAVEGTLIHMDDFFLRREQRTPLRYSTPGENVDHERFLAEVLQPLSKKETTRFHPFDCSKMELSDEVIEASGSGTVIVEGSYSHHPDLRSYYDLLVFMDVNPEVQMKRIEKRNPQKVEDFRNKWIPFEELYFEKYSVREQSDIVIDTSKLF